MRSFSVESAAGPRDPMAWKPDGAMSDPRHESLHQIVNRLPSRKKGTGHLLKANCLISLVRRFTSSNAGCQRGPGQVGEVAVPPSLCRAS